MVLCSHLCCVIFNDKWHALLYVLSFGGVHVLSGCSLQNFIKHAYLQLAECLSAPSACYDTLLQQFCSSPS